MSNSIQLVTPLTAALRPWGAMGTFVRDAVPSAVPAGKGAHRPRGVPR